MIELPKPIVSKRIIELHRTTTTKMALASKQMIGEFV